MVDSFNRLAKILRVKPEMLLELDKRMASITSQERVIEKIIEENDLLIERTLSELGLSRETSAQEVHEALQARLAHLDEELYELLGKPDLSKMEEVSRVLCQKSLELVDVKKGFFIKKERAVELLEKYPPQNLLDFFGYKSVRELIDKESFESVFSALRFTQSKEWMHNFFDTAYDSLKADDFEDRGIQLKVLEEKWLEVAKTFLEKKYHNVSHLKELGIIFVVPLKLDPSSTTLRVDYGAGTPGELLRLLTLILHYLNEVPFYSRLFRKFSAQENFVENFKALLRGDVLEGPLPDKSRMTWRIVQRYLAKDDPNDPRLYEPHINPEVEHWFKAEESLGRFGLKDKKGLALGFGKGLDFVGDFFGDEFVSFNLIDLVMTLVTKGQTEYTYHQREALWNKIFSEYVGREEMNELIEENIIKGYIEL